MAARVSPPARQLEGAEGSYPEIRRYEACSLSPDQRDIVSRLRIAWRSLGWKPADFQTLLGAANISVSARTIRRWSTEERVAETAPPKKVARGRPRLLDESQAAILAGYILERNRQSETTTVHTAIDFARESFDVVLSINSARRILDDCHFSSRAARRTAPTTTPKTTDLAKICSDWIRSMRKSGHFPQDRGLLVQ